MLNLPCRVSVYLKQFWASSMMNSTIWINILKSLHRISKLAHLKQKLKVKQGFSTVGAGFLFTFRERNTEYNSSPVNLELQHTLLIHVFQDLIFLYLFRWGERSKGSEF